MREPPSWRMSCLSRMTPKILDEVTTRLHCCTSFAEQLIARGPNRHRGSTSLVRSAPRRKLSVVIAAEAAALSSIGNSEAVRVSPVTQYLRATAGVALYPATIGCTVCGAGSRYNCVASCGARYCSVACGAAHRESSPTCSRQN